MCLEIMDKRTPRVEKKIKINQLEEEKMLTMVWVFSLTVKSDKPDTFLLLQGQQRKNLLGNDVYVYLSTLYLGSWSGMILQAIITVT